MNKMPGFTAEASLYKTSDNHYYINKIHSTLADSQGVILPQRMKIPHYMECMAACLVGGWDVSSCQDACRIFA